MRKQLNRPDLSYLRLTDEQARPALFQLGLSASAADALLEMSASLNSGYIRAQEKRSAQNTTPTSYETFVAQQFVPLYQGKAQAA